MNTNDPDFWLFGKKPKPLPFPRPPAPTPTKPVNQGDDK